MPDISASYASLSYAASYADSSWDADLWEATDDDVQIRALVEATRELSLQSWKDDVDLDAPADWLKNATVEAAIGMVRENRAVHVNATTSNVKRKKVDVIETEFFGPADGVKQAEGLSRFPRVMEIIRPYLDNSMPGGTVRLVR